MVFQGDERQHRSQSSRTHRHRRPGGEAHRQGHQPVALHSGARGIAAPVGLADTPSCENNLVTGRVARIVRGGYGSGKVDSGYMRVVAHQPPTIRRKAKAILVIDRGELEAVHF